MSNTFMGLRFKDFNVISRVTQAQITLKAQTREDALMTAQELLDEPLENLAVFQPTDW